MTVEIKKIPGGFLVDGIKLMNGKCDCTSIAKCGAMKRDFEKIT